jgi:hypothetical protein
MVVQLRESIIIHSRRNYILRDEVVRAAEGIVDPVFASAE